MKIKTDNLLKFSLVFFIALLSFAVGTFVGKQYSDQQHKLATMEPAKEGAAGEQKREVASTGEGDAAKAMSDEELAKLSAEFITDDKGEKKEGEATNAATEPQTEEKTVAANEHAPTATTEHTAGEHTEAKPADKHEEAPVSEKMTGKPMKAVVNENKPGTAVAVNNEKPEATVRKEQSQAAQPTKQPVKTETPTDREPSSVPKNLSAYNVGKFTVQLASFNTETEAKRRTTDLKNKGYAAFYIPAEIKGATWYRVSVGLFATEKEAKEYREAILKQGESKSALVQKVVK